jgi:hypothetical protein
MLKRNLLASVFVVSSLLTGQAMAFVCDQKNAANDAAREKVIPTISTNLTLALTLESTEIVFALQGLAAQISGNIRGSVNGLGMIIEGLSNQQEQRSVQDDQMAALVAHQYSTPLCQAATVSVIATQQAIAAQTVGIQRAQSNANWTSGLPVAGASSVAAMPQAIIKDRQSQFCAANDPACQGQAGARPNADRMLFSILSVPNLATQADRDQATWVINNISGPVPSPALTASDLNKPGGQELYVRRGGWETVANFVRDIDTEILLTRREKNTDHTFYNDLAARAGLPTVRGQVSTEDMDQMRYVLQFSPQYTASLATLSGDALRRQIAANLADQLRQGYETQKLLEKSIIAISAGVANGLEPKLASAAGQVK